MEEILDNLIVDETLYITPNGIHYLFINRTNDGGIKYSINQNSKKLPLATINAAYDDFINDIEINAQWYINYNEHEYETRPCNLSVLSELLNRL